MSRSTGARDRAEYGFAALLGAVALVLAYDALTLDTPEGRAGAVGPEAVPLGVSVLLIVCAVLLCVQVSRGSVAEPEGAEDVEPGSPIEWRTVVPLLAVMTANVLLIDTLGWVISGTLLFWGSLLALGSRTLVRDGVISVCLAVATFYGFYSGLGIYLPAGPLEGVL